MTRKIFAVLFLSLAVAACDSNSTETNSNANNPAKANTNGQVSPTPAPTSSPEASPFVKSEFKAGDRVKVKTNGSVADATIVSVDEKSGKVTVKLQADGKEKTVALSDVTKQ